tara:strand:+ start:271 stop:459 length:189 start_codon:yes stop_codon:yes gene_type:complete
MDKIVLANVVEMLEQKDFKKKLTKKLNKNIDIPIINEKTEQKILDKVYELIIDTIKNIDLDD